MDKFIIFDDIAYINKGYINRNKILVKGKPYQFTLELVGASQNKLINEIQIGKNSTKILKTIELNYKRADNFKNVFPLIQNIFNQEENNLAKFIGYSLKKITNYLDIDTNFIYSSKITKNNNLKNQDKIIFICEKLKANHYINLIGGVGLYDNAKFKSKNIKLSFLETNKIKYKQFNNKFVPFLSVIDVMMHNNKDIIFHMLKNYKMI